mmetsp:Transcript_404/g.902  ORF Transcript_404/g.902 Transcript_404/m.902 type:complete len:403 (+) Transcript_404:137-1345(+)|eukprot:CAMPEP_0172615300 /NCGR_PEP_ID=MMETSP1068-20121228/57493_1 /TAXON_ID=35684 /ORGANISM="Pseudopedinella elastica, Strain CCMP716" /LENGTH=402 /DNA_ID=CAMNT_0013420389 /DNA_START=119 /DNA_END=1327 /DNA_ORIENTATION=+
MSKRSIQVLDGNTHALQTSIFKPASVPHIETANIEPRPKHARSDCHTPEGNRRSPNVIPASPLGVEENITPKTGRWTKREDDLLKEAVEEFGVDDWKQVSETSFHGLRSEAQCGQRWAKVLSQGLRKGQWTEEEDAVVREQVALGGGPYVVKWTEVAEKLSGRLGKQVRERWQNHLDPELSKEPWQEHEDQLLVSLQAVMGNKWSEIARAFAGRSENSVKNRWNSKQRKSLAAERKLRTGSELGILVLGHLKRPVPGDSASSSAASGQALDEVVGCAIKIDFGKALKAAHGPHIVTGPEARRRQQQQHGAFASGTGAGCPKPLMLDLLLASVPKAEANLELAASLKELATRGSRAPPTTTKRTTKGGALRGASPAVVSDYEDDSDVKQAGATLLDILSCPLA